MFQGQIGKNPPGCLRRTPCKRDPPGWLTAGALRSPGLRWQGIPFFHAGDEMFRSKSLDRDSYNSGDWFNRSGPGLIPPACRPA